MKAVLHRVGMLAWAVGLALLAAGAWNWWQSTRSATPRSWLVVEPSPLSAGRLAPGEPRLLRLQVINLSGRRSARLLGASDFCDADGCVTSMGLPKAISPGGSTVVELEYKGLRPGPFRREVSLYTDSPGQAEIPLVIVGDVIGVEDVAARSGEPNGP